MTRQQPFIPVAEPDLTGNEARYLLECVDSGWVSSLGPFVRRLEEEFGAFIGVPHVAAVSSGTGALHLALVALGIGSGDEVIVPSLTFVATANAVRYVGATPVFADCEPRTWTLAPAAVAACVTSRTKAIIAVHLYGHPAEMDELSQLARARGLFLIEDAAEAHGASYRGRPIGSLADIATFSLFGNKVITSGEGGLVATNDLELDRTVRLYRDQGLVKGDSEHLHYWHPVIGFNYGMSNLQAAVAVAQLERIDHFVERKRAIAAAYTSRLEDCPNVEVGRELPWVKSSFWMTSLLVKPEAPISRDRLIQGLRECGVDSRPFFYPNHTLPAYATGQCLAVTEDVALRGINLPSSTRLTDEAICRISDTVKRLVN